MRKVLSLSVAICLAISPFMLAFGPIPSAAALTDGVWIYDVDGGNASISGYIGPGGAIIIPNTIGSGPFPVTMIGDYAFESKQGQLLTSVTIPDSITSIGSWAFRHCSALTAVTIPKSVRYLGAAAFWACTALTTVTIGNGVTTMGSNTFQGCTALTTVSVGDGLTSLPYAMFSGCTKLTSVIIPASVTSIGTHVFYGCTYLTNVTIPDAVTSIGESAFDGCTSLTSVTIPNHMTTIASLLFQKCAALTSVTISSSVTSIGAYAFYGCTSLTSVTIPNGVAAIGSNGFSFCSALTSVTIGTGVTTIGDHAFQSCPALINVVIGSGVKTIGDNAFYWCPRLATAWFLGDAPTTGTHIFLDCAAGFTVRYIGGTTGWTNPWYTYPTKIFVPQTHALTVIASGTGSVAKSPEGSSYQFGSVVALTATPAVGYVFGGWSGDVTGMTNPTVVAMDASKTVTASFKALPTYTLTPSAGTGGTVAPNTPQTVVQGGSISFVITPTTGYRIADISVDGASQGNVSSYAFTNVTSNHTIKAVFEKEQEQTVMVLQVGNAAFTVNGVAKTLDSPPVIKNGRTLVPIRAIIEALGGTVGWDGTARKATVTLGSAAVELWIGKSAAKVNGVSTLIDPANANVVPEIINGRTMLPVRFVSENLGCSVLWADATKTITITYEP